MARYAHQILREAAEKLNDLRRTAAALDLHGAMGEKGLDSIVLPVHFDANENAHHNYLVYRADDQGARAEVLPFDNASQLLDLIEESDIIDYAMDCTCWTIPDGDIPFTFTFADPNASDTDLLIRRVEEASVTNLFRDHVAEVFYKGEAVLR